MMAEIQRLGILTGGGDAPGLNAVIRAAVRTAERVYGIDVVGVLDGFTGLLDRRFVTLTSVGVRGIIAEGGTVLGTSNRVNPFAVPSDAGLVDRSAEVLENARQAGIDGLLVIGGDGTLKIAVELARRGLQLVGVPKTIDNDLAATDYTFGFWTAIGAASEALDRLRDTAESHHRVMILEVMGRNAGWIALHAGLAGGADVILIPEIPYSPQIVAEKIEERRQRDQAYSLVVVAEGAVAQGGKPTVKEVNAITGEPRLGGAGDRVATELRPLMQHEIRVTVLGHLQRGGSPVPYDRILATRFGARAASLAATGAWGQMVCLRGNCIEDVSIQDAVALSRFVDPEGELVRTARCIGVDFGAEPAD
jgi:phosphofructokinase-like protein